MRHAKLGERGCCRCTPPPSRSPPAFVPLLSFWQLAQRLVAAAGGTGSAIPSSPAGILTQATVPRIPLFPCSSSTTSSTGTRSTAPVAPLPAPAQREDASSSSASFTHAYLEDADTSILTTGTTLDGAFLYGQDRPP